MIPRTDDLTYDEKKVIAEMIRKPEFRLIEKCVLRQINIAMDYSMISEDKETLEAKQQVRGMRRVLGSFKDVWDEVFRKESKPKIKKPVTKVPEKIFGPTSKKKK